MISPTHSWRQLYDAFYPEGTRARLILEKHSKSVAALAADINIERSLRLDPDIVELAAMLHDIGIFLCDAPSIDCHGSRRYILHGILGADLLRRHGYPEAVARVAERHTGTGLTHRQAVQLKIPVADDRSLMPETELEELICYADKFYSKSADMKRKPLDRVRLSVAKHGDEAVARFDELHRRYAIASTQG